MGSCVFSILWVFPPGWAAAWFSQFLQPCPGSGVGRCSAWQTGSPEDGPVPPEALQMRPIRSRFWYCGRRPAILLYIELRGARPGAFFLDSSFRLVTKPWFIQKVRELLNSVGAPHLQFAGHSFRIGAATTAAMVGVEDSMIQTLGRWHSAAFLQYILPAVYQDTKGTLSSPVSYPRQGKHFSNPPLNLVSAPTPLNVVIHIQLVIIYVCLYAIITPSCMLY